MRSLLAFLLALVPGAARGLPCTTWPGEPTASESQGAVYAARHAELRAQDLRSHADSWQDRSPALARALRAHAACLTGGAAPNDSEAQPRVRIHRPTVAPQPPPVSAQPTLDLSAPLRVALAPRPAPKTTPAVTEPQPTPGTVTQEPTSKPPVPDVSGLLAEGEDALRGARYEDALVAAESATSRLAAAGNPAGARDARARASVMAATASLALGRTEVARAHFAEALAVDPKLALDPMQHSPKVMAIFDAVKGGRP